MAAEVSVIIRTCNGRNGALQAALETVRRQHFRPIEVVVVEDGSRHAEAMLTDWPTEPGLTLCYVPIAKAGRCVAGNIGLENASGEFCCFLDDDDGFYDDHLTELVAALKSRPELAAVYSLADELTSKISNYHPFQVTDLARRVFPTRPFNRQALWIGNFLPIQAVLFRRCLFEQYGGFDPELDNLEDWDLWVRYSAEADFLLINKVTSYFRMPSDPEENSRRAARMDQFFPLAKQKQRRIRIPADGERVLAWVVECLRQYRALRWPDRIRLINLERQSRCLLAPLLTTDQHETNPLDVVELANAVILQTPLYFTLYRVGTRIRYVGNRLSKGFAK